MDKPRLLPKESPGQYWIWVFAHLRAAISALYRMRRRALSGQTSTSNAAAELKTMGWREFEALVGDAFRLQGFMVAQRGGSGPDGDVDIVLSKSSELFLVQCKHWKTPSVGADVVQALHGVMVAQRAAGGFVVTSGGYTADAQSLGNAYNIQLIDGDKLIEMIRLARVSQDIQSRASASAAGHTVPQCPICLAAMIQREAKYGANTGTHFWSCTKFPNCRGTRELQGG